jgi:methylglutaconyl-CoA hydratase
VTLAISQRDEVAVLTIDRPEARNALDDVLIGQLTSAVERASGDPTTRVIVLTASGSVFSAGGDLAWMRRMANASREENLADARALATLLQTIDRSPKPTVARVNGSAFGGGLGLIAACDIAVSVATAEFAASEVRLGLVPAVISPYVVRAVGPREARRLFLAAERIPAEEARRIGLVHEIVAAGELENAIDRQVTALLAGGAGAIATAKRLVQRLAGIDDALTEETVRTLADVRTTSEAQEGIAAFFGKRRPAWIK